MKPLWIALSFSLLMVTAWADQPVKRSTRAVAETREARAGRQVGAMRVRSFTQRNAAVVMRDATTPPPAPGVVQAKLEQGNLYAYFIATAVIPKGSTFGGYIGSDNGSWIDFDSVKFNNDLQAGDYVQLPEISKFGDLWPQGITTITVDVTINGKLTETNGEVLFGYTPTYSDLQTLLPVISSTAQSINGAKDMVLSIRGMFSNSTPVVVLGSWDWGNWVVPQSAILSATTSQIDVDLSLVPQLDLSTMNEYLLTVGQGSYADTVSYRYVPAPPKSFNLAPQ